MAVKEAGITVGVFGLIAATGSLLLSIFSFFSVVLGVFGVILSSLPFILLALVTVVIMIPFVGYSDVVIEEVEYGMRTKIFPIWRDTVREFVNLLRYFFNPLVCFWNAVNWWFFGLFREALFPTLGECGIGIMLANLGSFFLTLFDDLVRYFLTFQWISGNPLDFTDICDKWIVFMDSWINLYRCSCFDIGDLLAALPITTFTTVLIINPFSAQWADRQLWCAVENIFNGTMAIVGEILRLLALIFNVIFFSPPPSPFPRPDFRRAARLYCDAVQCLVRSFENAFQRLWDKFVPFEFLFEEWLCGIDTLACLIITGIDNARRILFHIDRVVQYPNDNYWETVVKPDFIEWINFVAPVTEFAPIPVPAGPQPVRFVITNYFLSTTSPSRPGSQGGGPNPIFGKKRLTECICIFVERLLCDPRNMDTPCFSQTAQQILMGFDFCCLTDSLLIGAANIVTALFEFTLHLGFGADEFFLYIDEQPFTTILKNDLVQIVACLLSIFTLIPEIGECIQDLITAAAKYILCVIDFLIRVVLALGSLPYFLIELPGTPNFVTRMDEALDFFVQIHEDLIAPTPDSFLTCLCTLINKGFPVPPIPCSTCQVNILPGVPAKRTNSLFDPGNSPMDIVANHFGPSVYTQRVTPLISYSNYTMNPFKLGKMIYVNSKFIGKNVVPFTSLKSVDNFVDYQKEKILDRWNDKKRCDKLDEEYSYLEKYNPKELMRLRRRGHWTDTGCPAKQDRTWMLKQEPEEQQQVLDTRLTIGPTVPPLTGCDPTPPCFDLCCVFRTVLEFLVHMLQFAARFFNGIIQGQFATNPPTGDYRYFTGEACDILGEDCFESDILMAVIKLVAPLRCLCEFINLVIPVTPQNPRGDLCCAIQRIGELVACILQVIINSINALAMGAPHDYFVQNMFFEDVSTLFDITLEVVTCLCVLLRGIFPLSFIPGFEDATNFDICCITEVVVVTLVETVRLFLQIVIALATITVTPESFCYFRLDTTGGCTGGTLDDIGMVKQIDVIFDSFFSTRDGQCEATCGKDHGQGGIGPCLCQIVNTLIPARPDPLKPVICDPSDPDFPNCQTVDFCCPIIKLAIVLNDLGKFLNRLLVSTWQSWTPNYPEFFVNYLFCDEPERALPANPDPGCLAMPCPPPDGGMAACGCGTFTCGRLKPFIDGIVAPQEGLIPECLCEYFVLLDILLANYIGLGNWSATNGCFCGKSNGILRAASLFYKTVIDAGVNLIRLFPLPCFWKPCSGAQGNFNVEKSWIYSFLGPIADAVCISTGNLACFFNNLFFLPGQCLAQGKIFFGGLTRWFFEFWFVLIGFIEGFVRSLVEEEETCFGGECGSHGNTADVGGVTVSGSALGEMITIAFTFPVDLFLGDAAVACTNICPAYLAQLPFGDNRRCECYNLSPVTRIAPNPGFPSRWNVRLFGFGTLQYGCQVEFLNFPGTYVGPIKNTCTPQVCQDEGLCRPDSLPSCARHPSTPFSVVMDGALLGSIDGINIALIKYLRCIIRGFGLPDFFKPFAQLLSYTWQIWGGVARFLSSLVIFILSLFSGFGFLGLGALSSLRAVFSAFFAIFTQPLIIENKRINFIGPVKRESFSEFKRGYVYVHQNQSLFEQLAYVLYDYDVDDCFDDPVTCSCRNIDMPQHCEWDAKKKEVRFKRTTPLSTSELTHIMATECFTGSSPCDHVIQGCDNVDWNNIDFAIKTEWVQCMDLYVRGNRLHHAWPEAPADYFYTDRSKLFLFRSIGTRLREFAREESENRERENFPKDMDYDDPEQFTKFIEQRKREEREFKTRLVDFDKQIEQRKNFSRIYLEKTSGIDQYSPIFEAMVKADSYWFKWKSGYYNHIFGRAGTLIERGETKLLPTPEQALDHLVHTIKDMAGRINPHGNETGIIQSTREAINESTHFFKKSWERGLWNVIKEDHYYPVKKKVVQLQDDVVSEKVQALQNAWNYSPLVRWWNRKRSKKHQNTVWFHDLRKHLNQTIEYAQTHDDAPWSFWNMGLRLRQARRDVVTSITQPKWTPEKLANWERVYSFGYKIYDTLYPGSLPKEVHDRFIFNCNCVLADRILPVTVGLVDYCVMEFMPNVNFMKKNENDETVQLIRDALNKTGIYRRSELPRDRYHFPTPQDPNAWIRPKLIPSNKTVARTIYHREIYKRATGSGSTGFNLLDWFICVVGDIFDDDFSQRLDNWFDDLRDWFSNDNTSVDDYPDNVGFLYWVTFWVRCDWPQNLNCSHGRGLEEAIRITAIIFIFVFVIGALVIPSLLIPLSLFGIFFLVIVVIPAIAWHYSPTCWFLTPSFPLGGGVQLPIWPVPVAYPTLPECFMDSCVGLLDKFVTDCYDFWIPDYMVNGEVCPTDPNQRIDWINCKDVGISDGLQNILYLGYWWFGSDFTNAMITVAGTCIGMLWPGLDDYLRDTLNGFETANETQEKRQKFCFWATLPAIFPVLLFIFLIGLTLGLLIPAIVDIIRSLFLFLFATPAAEAIPGDYGEEWFPEGDYVDNEEEEDIGGDEMITFDGDSMKTRIFGQGFKKKKLSSSSIFPRISQASSYYMKDWLWPSKEQEKKKKE